MDDSAQYRRYINCDVETKDWFALIVDLVKQNGQWWYLSDYGYMYPCKKYPEPKVIKRYS